MTDTAWFTVDGTRCQMVRIPDFKFVDWALIRDLTGLDKERFVFAHNEERDAPPDPLVILGYAAVAFWHHNPTLDRERIGIEAGNWGEDDIALELPPAAADAGPPDVPAGSSGSGSSGESSTTSEPSNESPDAPSESTSPPDSGPPGSDTGSPESPPTG